MTASRLMESRKSSRIRGLEDKRTTETLKNHKEKFLIQLGIMFKK